MPISRVSQVPPHPPGWGLRRLRHRRVTHDRPCRLGPPPTIPPPQETLTIRIGVPSSRLAVRGARTVGQSRLQNNRALDTQHSSRAYASAPHHRSTTNHAQPVDTSLYTSETGHTPDQPSRLGADRLARHHAYLVPTKGDSHRLAEALAGKGVIPWDPNPARRDNGRPPA